MDQLTGIGRPGRREALMLAVAALALVTLRLPLVSSVRELALIFFASWALCLGSLVERQRGGIYRPSAIYLLLFGFFHGGLLLSIALLGQARFLAYDTSWLYEGETPKAVYLAIIGMAIFTLAAQLASGASRVTFAPRRDTTPAPRSGLAVVGLVVEFAGLVLFGAAVLPVGGLNLLSGGYAAFLHANESSGTLGYGTFCIGVGAVCSVIAGGRARIIGWVTFVAYGTVGFLIGTRGAVLFPLVVLLMVEARRGHRPRRMWTIIGALAVLVGISIGRRTRSTGFATPSNVSSLLHSPFDAMAEMGFSLHPTVTVLGWHASGEPFRDGITLIAGPLRFVENITGWHGGPPIYDDRLFNLVVAERVGQIGGSPIAEGYYNFGTVGVVLLLAALGLAVGWLERRPLTGWGDALVGVFLLPLLFQIRNSFAPIPAQLALGLLLLWIARVWSSRPDRAPMSARGGDHAPDTEERPARSPV